MAQKLVTPPVVRREFEHRFRAVLEPVIEKLVPACRSSPASGAGDGW
jgi:hypothetical protein